MTTIAGIAERRAETTGIAAAIVELRDLLGDALSTSPAVRERHGMDESFHPAHPPDAVAMARSTAEVAQIVTICRRHGVPVIPFGTGTSLEGHVAAIHGGICIDVSAMNEIVRLNPEDMDVTVQAGVTRNQLNEHIRDTGLFFPIDPGANASLGGMAATRASGTNAVRYGTMRENVLALEVVLPDGAVIRTARRARKSSAGYDLTRLFVGSEGTLGVITEVTVRLHGIPEAISSATCDFEEVGGAVDTVIQTIQSGVPIARMELMDAVAIRAVNRFHGLDLTERPTLFLEFHGSKAGVAEQVDTVAEIAGLNGGGDFRWTATPEERSKLWRARHELVYAAKALRPGSAFWSTDVCVPISRLAACIDETRRELDQSSLLAPILGHVGDGNFHAVFILDPANEAEIAEARRLNDAIVARALAMDGTCTGEHGIGLGKLDFLVQEHGEAAVATMRRIKQAIDPDNIMNPGKVLRC